MAQLQRFVSAELPKPNAESEIEKYRLVQDRLYESYFDWMNKNLPPKETPRD